MSAPANDHWIEPPLAHGHCPDCGRDHWRMGPRGGLSQNIECMNCKARFNVTRYMGTLLHCDRLEKEDEGGSVWREDMFPR